MINKKYNLNPVTIFLLEVTLHGTKLSTGKGPNSQAPDSLASPLYISSLMAVQT